ncbi:CCA tRNA nucleotidyltransferase [Patescibacteria group bacterium]|nr:CCA tRNA nucleotidyltransferase [Patescibacteria group bacterium]
MLKSAEKIVDILAQNGFTAYFAGGAVRDRLLNRKVSDIDIATNAKPDDVEKLFEKTHPIGREFGVTLVIFGKHAFEVATFRGEKNYDGRRPREVFFTNAEEDARRRDFTVNGMFFDPRKKRVLDFVGGEKDLKKRLIRFIGNAEERVREDFLRILRGVRFRNLLNFEYEETTKKAIRENGLLLLQISGERIRDELGKIFENENRGKAVRDLEEFGILEVLIPELTKLRKLPQPQKYHLEGDCFTHSLAAFSSLPKSANLALAWATLLHDIGKAETIRETAGEISYPSHAERGVLLAEKILHRFRFDNATRAKIVWLIGRHMDFFQIPEMRGARQHEFFTHPWFTDLVKLTAADIRGTSPANFSLHRKIVRGWKTHAEEKLLPPPRELLNGEEIIRELHIAKGPAVGRLKRILKDAQIEELVGSRKEAVKFLESCLKR